MALNYLLKNDSTIVIHGRQIEDLAEQNSLNAVKIFPFYPPVFVILTHFGEINNIYKTLLPPHAYRTTHRQTNSLSAKSRTA